eukprot:TRINITY_DN2806_c0_g2_i1.p1 TRINITY_DN2806_c0_g2~~TRINITY_DN2806_c0_g2_i1.p1  ORF type:complete len:462 (+),score=116.25 TRINITY_DN2806_c0_g2_i1:83-1468(+)
MAEAGSRHARARVAALQAADLQPPHSQAGSDRRRSAVPLPAAVLFAAAAASAAVAVWLLWTQPLPAPQRPAGPQGCMLGDGGGSSVYGVVFDAGSTGTRMHVFRFESGALKQEVYRDTRPGLSGAYINGGPQAAAGTLRPLLSSALDAVPEGMRSCTDVALHATAGLRLLQQKSGGAAGGAAEAVLSAVRSVLGSTPFRLGAGDVKVVSGAEEAADAWLAVNFLTGAFADASAAAAAAAATAAATAAVLDMGGASTQVVLADDSADAARAAGMLEVHFRQREWRLLQHSLLGLGLKEAGKRIKGLVSRGTHHPCVAVSNGGPARDFAACSALVRRALPRDCSAASPCATDELARALGRYTGDIYAFSYVHDRARRWLPASGRVTVGWFADLAADVCRGGRSARGRMNKGTMCMDLCFIHALLEHGLGLQRGRRLVVLSHIGGFEASWPLGTMLRRLDAMPQ